MNAPLEGARGPERALGGLDVGSKSRSRRSRLRAGRCSSWSFGIPPASGVGSLKGSSRRLPEVAGCVFGGYPQQAGGAEKARHAPAKRVCLGAPSRATRDPTPDAGGIPRPTAGAARSQSKRLAPARRHSTRRVAAPSAMRGVFGAIARRSGKRAAPPLPSSSCNWTVAGGAGGAGAVSVTASYARRAKRSRLWRPPSGRGEGYRPVIRPRGAVRSARGPRSTACNHHWDDCGRL